MSPAHASGSAVCEVCERHAESVYRVEGMDCHEEVALLERRLKPMPGVEGLTADVVNQRVWVRYDAARVTSDDLVAAIAHTGMRAWLQHERPIAPLDGAGRLRMAGVIVSGLALGAGLVLDRSGAPASAVWSAYATSIACGSALTLRRALAAARGFALDINVLMLVAVIGAMALRQWSEAATVIFLFALAQLLESRSMERARHAIRELMNLAPGEALVRRDGTDQRVRAEEVIVGETILVRPGEKIPLDGRVIAGASHVDQAPITGESQPAEKHAGSEVFAGTINGTGALEIAVTRVGHDTTLGRIISLVEVAQAERAPAQAFVERFARTYTPAVLALAFAVAVVPPIALAQPLTPWIYRALVLLVISCPCALVISTPVSIVSALAGAARRGVLIKGGLHLERAATVTCVALDKTGTLTTGRPAVVEILSLDGATPREILRVAAALEARSEHPIGAAIVRHARHAGVIVPGAEAFQALPGLGAEAVVEGRTVLVGNHRLFAERTLGSGRVDAELEQRGRAGQTAVLVAVGGAPVGLIGLADEMRAGANLAVDELRREGVSRIVMLTGDNLNTARAIADEAGVDEFRAELLPEDKVDAIDALRKAHGAVAMVGDGVNDAPALAAADLGIAMGAAGSDAALETADIALMADDLTKLPYVRRLGQATVRNIRANITFSLVLKGAFLALGVAGLATLWMAVVADMGASLVVIANGLRLLRAE
jgi:Cd2+/Zn2+-exporting ATPase